MKLEPLRRHCLSLPSATEDIKWGDDLVFSIGGKMFAVVYLQTPHHLSFRCTPEEFALLAEREGACPAPYLARHHWIQVENLGVLPDVELKRRLRDSYDLVRARLPKRLRESLG